MKLLLALAGALLGGTVVDALLGTWSPTHYCRIASTGLDSSINVPQGGLLGIGQFVFDSYARTLSHRIVHGLNITSSNSWTFNYTNSLSGSLGSGNFSLSLPQGSTLVNKNITNPMVGTVWLGNQPNVDAFIQGGLLAIHISNGNGLVGRCNLFGIHQQEVELIAPSNAGVHSYLTVNYDNNGLSFVPPVFPNSSNSNNNNNGATGLQNSNNTNNNNNQASASAFIDFDEATSMTVFSINTGVTNNSNMDVYLACGSVICWYNTTNQVLIQGVAYCPSFINGNCSILAFVNNSNTVDPNADRFNMSNLAWTGLIRGPIVLTTMMGFNSMNTSQLGAAILYGTNIESSPIIVDLDVILPSRPSTITVSKGLLGSSSRTPILSDYDLSSVPFNNFTNGYWGQSIRFNVSAPVSTIQSYLNILSAASPSDMDVVLSVTSVNGNVIDASFEALTELNTDTYYTHTCFLIPSVNFSSSDTAASPFAGAGVFSYNADTQLLSFALLHTLQNPGAGWLSLGYPGEVGTQIASIQNSTSPIVGAVMLSSALAMEFWRDHLFISFPGIQNGARCQIVGKDSQEVALSVIQSPLVAPGTTPTPSGPTSTPTTAYATTAPISPTTNASIVPTTTGVLPTTVTPTTNSSITPTTGILPTGLTIAPTTASIAPTTTAAASVLPTTVVPTSAGGAGARRRLLQVFSSTAVSSTGVESSSSTGLESSSSSTGLESSSSSSSSSSTGLESSSSSSSTGLESSSSSSTGIESSSSTGAESSSTGAVPTTITPTTPSVVPTTVLPTSLLPTTLLPTTPTTASVLPTSPTIAPTTIPATSAVIVPTSSIPTSPAATTAPVSEAPFSGCLLRLNRLNRKLWYNCNAVASAGPLQSLVIQDMNGANLFTLGCANINCNGTLTLTALQLSEYVAGHWSFVFNGQVTTANRLVSHAAVQTTMEDFVLYNFTAPMSWSQRLVAQFPANSVDATDVNFWTPSITNIPVRPVFSLAVALFWQGANGTTVLSSGSNYLMSGLPVLSSIVFANFQPSAAHIHGPARPGVNTGVLIPISVNTNQSSLTNTWVGVINQATESIQFLDYMAMELLYENVHSPIWPDGEVRGQLFPLHLKTCPVPDRFDMLAF